MPSLKDFRIRIGSVKNTRKITSAMKMVAASKLRQAQARAETGRPYARKMAEALARLVVASGTRSEKIRLRRIVACAAVSMVTWFVKCAAISINAPLKTAPSR